MQRRGFSINGRPLAVMMPLGKDIVQKASAPKSRVTFGILYKKKGVDGAEMVENGSYKLFY